MNWLVKVLAFKLMSGVPGGGALYRFCQEQFTRSLVPTRGRVMGKIEAGLQYWDWLASRGETNRLIGGTHLDFGTGWHPTIPILFHGLGVERQFLFDAAPVLDLPMLEATIGVYREIATDKTWARSDMLKRLPKACPENGSSLAARLKELGMTYHAPCTDQFPEIASSVDCVTATQVLYYIPRPALRECLRQIQGCLKPGGLFLATVRLNDLYSHSQPGLSQYNNLRYSPWLWDRCLNSRLMSFNRLRAADYRELLGETGFKVLQFDVEGPTADDLRELERVAVHESFQRYSCKELGAKNLFFVAART